MKKLVVHIGCAKGGSSAIQAGLRINHQELARRGIAVPAVDLASDTPVTGSHAPFFEARLEERRATPMPELGDLLEETADRVDANTVVISAENLSNPNGFEEPFACLAARFDIKIVLYVRRQDDLLESSWQQWDIKQGGSLLAWMIRNIGVRGNWSRVVEPWAGKLGDDRIVARVYDRSLLAKEDVFLDFCEVLGQDSQGLELPGERNPGLSPMLSRMVEGNAHLFEGPHDQSFYDSVRALAPELLVKEAGSPGLFSREEAQAVMSVYAQGNERFRRRYLPHIKRPLFAPKRRAGGRSELSQDAFERRLLQLEVFRLHKQLDELRQHLGLD